MDRDEKYPLIWTLLMLDYPDIPLLHNQFSKLLKRDSPLLFKLRVFLLIPDNVHDSIYDILYTMSNFQSSSTATAHNMQKYGAQASQNESNSQNFKTGKLNSF